MKILGEHRGVTLEFGFTTMKSKNTVDQKGKGVRGH